MLVLEAVLGCYHVVYTIKEIGCCQSNICVSQKESRVNGLNSLLSSRDGKDNVFHSKSNRIRFCGFIRFSAISLCLSVVDHSEASLQNLHLVHGTLPRGGWQHDNYPTAMTSNTSGATET